MPPSMIPLVLLSACRVVFQCASNWSHEAALCGTWLLSTVMLHVRRWQAFHLVVKLSGEKLCLTSPRQATQSNHCNRAVIHIYVYIYICYTYIYIHICVCACIILNPCIKSARVHQHLPEQMTLDLLQTYSPHRILR